MSSMAGPSPQAIVPFTAAALRYREKIWTKQWTPGAAAQDVSPPGGAIKSYGYLRTLELVVTTVTPGTSTGSPAFGNADGPWSFFSQVIVTQPNGEEMFGGPTFTGYHAYLAAVHQGWRLNNTPYTLPSFSIASVLAPQFVLPITFEMDAEHGLGAIPNQDFSAPWKLVLTAAASAVGAGGAVYQTAPTTTNPTLQLDVFMNCWTVPSPVNPLNPNVAQETTPALLGTLNKWSLQQYTVPANSAFNVLLQRKGNAIRNFVFVIRNSSGVRLATTIFPNPFNMKWDGTVIKANDSPLLIVDDEYHTRGGVASVGAAGVGATAGPVADTGVMAIQMSDVSGVDAQGVAESYGMNAFWGTVQSSTIEIGGTWGAAAATLEVLTNDVQFVDLAGNPYAFAYGGYLQAPAQPKALP